MRTFAGVVTTILAISLAGCTNVPKPVVQNEKMSDGDLTVPANYKSWPKFLSDIQRADSKQVRDIYINPIGNSTKMGDAFPNGTITVMEIYKAREAADGTPLKGPDGKFVKGNLVKIGVMGKGPGWGDTVSPPELRNGDWVYSMYMADGKTKAPDDTATCRACHLPLKDKDYIFRYDEYFQKRNG
ncbi:MAG TPA: cytochrome P460 family protein [Nitrosospira sp.]|nr:cytochrome P460 family protein [Nitrosospira sp.]